MPSNTDDVLSNIDDVPSNIDDVPSNTGRPDPNCHGKGTEAWLTSQRSIAQKFHKCVHFGCVAAEDAAVGSLSVVVADSNWAAVKILRTFGGNWRIS